MQDKFDLADEKHPNFQKKKKKSYEHCMNHCLSDFFYRKNVITFKIDQILPVLFEKFQFQTLQFFKNNQYLFLLKQSNY